MLNQLKLSAQRALLGHIVPSLRAVSVDYKENTLIWHCLFTLDAPEKDVELLAEAATEFLADFSDSFTLKEIYTKSSTSEKISLQGQWVFLRHEI